MSALFTLNISDDKGTQLKLSEQPDFEQETEFLAKKEQPEQKCSDCYHLAERAGFEPALRLLVLTP